jgi:hypothetical protein
LWPFVNQVRKADFNSDPYLQTFGVSVASHMTDVQGRVLPAPRLQYGGRVRVLLLPWRWLLPPSPPILLSPSSFTSFSSPHWLASIHLAASLSLFHLSFDYWLIMVHGGNFFPLLSPSCKAL